VEHACPHCGVGTFTLCSRVASTIGIGQRCPHCAGAIGVPRIWQHAFTIGVALTFVAAATFSISLHAYSPYLLVPLVAAAIATLSALFAPARRLERTSLSQSLVPWAALIVCLVALTWLVPK